MGTTLVGAMVVHSSFNWMVELLHGDLQMILAANVGVASVILLMFLIREENKPAMLRWNLRQAFHHSVRN